MILYEYGKIQSIHQLLKVYVYVSFVKLFPVNIFRPRMPGFLKLLWFALWCVCVCVRVRACVCVCICVCASVCLPPRALITSGVIWCNIGCVRLVKQVSWLFPAFNYFFMTLAIDRMDGHGHISTARRERLPKKTKVTWY